MTPGMEGCVLASWWTWGSLSSALWPVFPHPPPSSLALPSLPPSATKCQHISLYVPFPALPTPYPPAPISRSCAQEKLSSQPFTANSKWKPVSFPSGTCLVSRIPNSGTWCIKHLVMVIFGAWRGGGRMGWEERPGLLGDP